MLKQRNVYVFDGSGLNETNVKDLKQNDVFFLTNNIKSSEVYVYSDEDYCFRLTRTHYAVFIYMRLFHGIYLDIHKVNMFTVLALPWTIRGGALANNRRTLHNSTTAYEWYKRYVKPLLSSLKKETK